jgi:hypothetical protein
MDPLQTVLGKRKRSEERGGDPKRMNGRTNVMMEAGHRQFRSSRSAAYCLARFQNTNRVTRACDFNGRRQAIRARADNDHIEFHVIEP